MRRAGDNAIWDDNWNSEEFQIEGCNYDYTNTRIMWISGTGGKEFKIVGMKFSRGYAKLQGWMANLEEPTNPAVGSGLYLNNNSIVVLETCSFDSCKTGNAMYVTGSSTLKMFTNSFNDNADVDIYINTGAVTVHEACPEGWSGTPTSSASLDTNVRTDLGATFSGTAESFSLGERVSIKYYRSRLGLRHPTNPTRSISIFARLPDNPSPCSYKYCQGGSYTYLTQQSNNLAKLCVPCPPGRFSSEGDTLSDNNVPVGICGRNCAAGKYKSGTTCLDRTSGKFSDGTTIGITTCKR